MKMKTMFIVKKKWWLLVTEDNIYKPGLKQQQIRKQVPFQTDPSSSTQSIYTLKGANPPSVSAQRRKL